MVRWGVVGPGEIAAGFAEVHRCLAERLTESPAMTLDETISIAAIRAWVLAGDARTAQPTPL